MGLLSMKMQLLSEVTDISLYTLALPLSEKTLLKASI